MVYRVIPEFSALPKPRSHMAEVKKKKSPPAPAGATGFWAWPYSQAAHPVGRSTGQTR
jgi:hypothetical protein